MRSLFVVIPLALAFSTTAHAGDIIKPTGTCLTKISSTFRLVDLYVKSDQVGEFVSQQLDITHRQCEAATDPAFDLCKAGLMDVYELAQQGRGIEAKGRAQRAAPACDEYRDSQDKGVAL